MSDEGEVNDATSGEPLPESLLIIKEISQIVLIIAQ
jgi:hypothetical protein